MDSETRHNFRAVSSSCRQSVQSVHAYTTTLRYVQSHSLPRESIPIPKCPNVRSLDIHHFHSYNQCLDGPIPVSVCSLEALNLSGSWQLKDVSALGYLTNLQTLDISDCWQLVDVSALVSCHNLQALCMSHCKQLVDVSALGSCPNLQMLNMSHCRQLVEVSALSSCPNLQTLLHMCYCQKLADVSALSSCQHLHTLDVSYCQQLVDVSALSSCPNLQTLDMSGCRHAASRRVCIDFLPKLAGTGHVRLHAGSLRTCLN